MSRARDARRARAEHREKVRTALMYFLAVVVGVAGAFGIDAWIHQR